MEESLTSSTSGRGPNGKKSKQRKTAAKIREELERVIEMLTSGKSHLEIQHAMGLKSAQLKSHLFAAASQGVSIVAGDYLTLQTSSLPGKLREYLGANREDILKVERRDDGDGWNLSLLQCDSVDLG
jgi:hypothetical protein